MQGDEVPATPPIEAAHFEPLIRDWKRGFLAHNQKKQLATACSDLAVSPDFYVNPQTRQHVSPDQFEIRWVETASQLGTTYTAWVFLLLDFPSSRDSEIPLGPAAGVPPVTIPHAFAA